MIINVTGNHVNYFTRDTLLQRVKNPEAQDSWDDFVLTYSPYIYSVIKNLGVKESEIDDLMQSVFVTCWEKLPGFDYDPQKGKFRYWLCRITTWACNNQMRKSARRSKILAENFDPSKDTLPSDIEAIVDKEWKVFISNKAWENVRETLSGKMLESYERYLKGESVSDIASDLGVVENTVQVYRSRIEKRIIAEIQLLKSELS